MGRHGLVFFIPVRGKKAKFEAVSDPMEDALSLIQRHLKSAAKELYGEEPSEDFVLAPTRKEFTGDFTAVTFPLTRMARKKPETIGEDLGRVLRRDLPVVSDCNAIQGFLNITLSAPFWTDFLVQVASDTEYGNLPRTGERVLVEFSSPNTNKPLHLGHVRNILIGWSVSRILEAAGHEVFRVQIINDRGIAICKSMLAWKIWGGGRTPATEGVKGDFFVGNHYVLFEKKFQEEYAVWQASPEGQEQFHARHEEGQSPEVWFKAFRDQYFNAYSDLGKQAGAMLRDWEAGDPETLRLWEEMNTWVYEGFDETYRRLGVRFDKLYYESETYLLGRDIVQQGLESGVFYRESDGSVWIDLSDVQLDRKVVLRKDGTSVYITQDIGTAALRYADFHTPRMVYVVADEQNYHFQVLFEISKRLKMPYADGLYHLSYGMVDLPTGKMKSREGKVVDADDLVEEVIAEARSNCKERGTLVELPAEEREEIIRRIGLAALKFFIVKVQPRKRMTFDPRESVDLQGQTGPYIQNAYVRIRSVLRKAGTFAREQARGYANFTMEEKELLNHLYQYPGVIREAARQADPAAVANFAYSLAKEYHRFYHEHNILGAEDISMRSFRLCLCEAVARVLTHSMDLLGIAMPEKM